MSNELEVMGNFYVMDNWHLQILHRSLIPQKVGKYNNEMDRDEKKVTRFSYLFCRLIRLIYKQAMCGLFSSKHK